MISSKLKNINDHFAFKYCFAKLNIENDQEIKGLTNITKHKIYFRAIFSQRKTLSKLKDLQKGPKRWE